MLGKFIADLRNYHALTPEQQKNASALLEVSEKFHKKALITGDDIRVESDRPSSLNPATSRIFFLMQEPGKKRFFYTTYKLL